MNHLAHALLANAGHHSLIGNLSGDFVKGPLDGLEIHARVREGIRQHRRVDVFTDQHEVTAELKKIFKPVNRRYAGILLDVVFDHYLIKHWSRFSEVMQRPFVNEVYATLTTHEAILPGQLADFVPRMIAADWLYSCESLVGVDRVLQRISNRLRYENPLGHAIDDINRHYEVFETGFLVFFPEAMASQGWGHQGRGQVSHCSIHPDTHSG
ncbi:DUF479 domain-containing protein [Kineobactrum sediminis]|uniref:DUF479 domain-containing protein n=1 Tax=Kineobactrum sediminis TaxID=1905677 RepID=A0A2N5Y182_9GAMM|nr:ACP phosphodiesterase [Kineobactrum sediminis]PLW82145.1 DUF479 domain-containing protein [Kineobactrum sediminis]